MNIFEQALQLIIEPPGNLVYYLVTLFALEAILAMAMGEWLRGRRTASVQRWLLASAGMLLTRGVLMVVALLAWQGLLESAILMPPLERFMDVLVLLFLGWAVLSWSDRLPTVATGLLVVVLLLGLIGYAAAAVDWHEMATSNPDLVFNGSVQDLIWSALALGVLALIGLGLLTQVGPQWEILLSVLLILSAGYITHLLAPNESDVAGWVRLANLVAYPLLAGLVYRRVLDWRQQDLAAAVQRTPGPRLDLDLLRTTQDIGASLDLDTTLVTAVSLAARTLRAEVCAIGLPTDQTHRRIDLVVVHNAMQATEEGEVFDLDGQPLVKRAIRTRRQVLLLDPDPQSAELFDLMGEADAGPLLVQPLIDDRSIVGVLIAGNPHSKRVWTEEERQIAGSFALQIATAIGNAKRFQQAAWSVNQLAQNKRLQEQETHRLRAELEQSQQDVQEFGQRIYDLEQQIERQERQARELATMLHLRETKTEEDALRAQIERLSRDRARLETQAQEWKEVAEGLKARQAQLETELAQAYQQAYEIRGDQGGEVDTIPSHAILVSDHQGKVVAVQGNIESLLDRDRSLILGQPIQDLYQDWRPEIQSLMTNQDIRHELVDFPKVVHLTHNGQTLRTELTPIPSPNAQSYNGIIAVLYGEKSWIEGSYQAELVASLVQELRTPMTSIIGYTDLVLGESVGILGAMQRKFLQRVKANIERMNSKLDDLIEITAIDSGQLQIEPETVNIVSIIEEAILNTAGQFRERGIAVDVLIEDDLPEVHADPDALNQVMLNILSNACQASEMDTTVTVRASLQEASESGLSTSSYLMVSVSDTGGGIADADRRRVFTRLYRADNPLIPGLGETGVGLSVAKTLVEAHGGRMWLETEEGVGSTFSFLLPIERPPALQEEDDWLETVQ
jgi:signal transduction histidine kinase